LAKIAHQRDTYKWTFLFLGANQDATTAAQLSIGSQDAATYCADAIGTSSGQRAMSRKMSALRTTACDPRNLTSEEQADLEAPSLSWPKKKTAKAGMMIQTDRLSIAVLVLVADSKLCTITAYATNAAIFYSFVSFSG
jgi:hypothetical protein